MYTHMRAYTYSPQVTSRAEQKAVHTSKALEGGGGLAQGLGGWLC